MGTRKMWMALLGLLAFPVLAGLVLWRLGVVSLDTRPSDEQTPVDLRSLAALPYTDYVAESEERKKRTGVVYYDTTLAYSGVNLYCNHYETTSGAYMIDMTGNVVHQWDVPDGSAWKAVTLDKKGNAYGVLERSGRGGRLVKLDWDSTVLFELPGPYHHDIQFLSDGSVVTLRTDYKTIRHKRRPGVILNDYLVVISPDGQIAKEISLFEVVREEGASQALLDKVFPMPRRAKLDLLHTNTAHVLADDLPGFCRNGNILICMRNLDLIFVYDLEADEIVWKHDGDGTWQHPHEPQLLRSGNLLIFDNGTTRGWSRVIEMDPMTQHIVWEYKGNPPTSFFTAERGSAQRLPNGNTLITESDTGRAFEVTRDGEIVWEWYNPLFSEGNRSIVYRMKRFDPDVVDAWTIGTGDPRSR